MKIAHLCLSCFYIDGMNYQENQLVSQHIADGHDVLVIASTETYGDDGKIMYCDSGEYMGGDGARVIRLPYRKGLPQKVMRKLRMHPGVYSQLESFAPDAILFHGACGYEIVVVARYARDNPHVLFYVDSHEAWHNSAKNFVSREILHRLFYGFRLRQALPKIDKILCVSTETMDFVEELYSVPRSALELYPLGGHPVGDEEYYRRRTEKRAELGISPDSIIFAQTGKMRKHKRLPETLRAFTAAADASSHFIIGGILPDEIREEVERLIDADPRIIFLGWLPTEDLTDLLCAADVYLHPGGQSATTQHSLCCRCAVVLSDDPSHHLYMKDTGWLVGDSSSLEAIFKGAEAQNIDVMKRNAYALACSLLDYAVLAQRVLQPTKIVQNSSVRRKP